MWGQCGADMVTPLTWLGGGRCRKNGALPLVVSDVFLVVILMGRVGEAWLHPEVPQRNTTHFDE